ncbi:MAG: hypothetical protein R3D98_08760 [Candidatus Krumholzibacteriia bacterium]
MVKRITASGLVALAALALVLGIGCGPSTDLTGSPIPNSLPDTRVTARPPDVLETGFVVQFFWTGFDPDGRIAGYQWKLSNNGVDGISVQDTLTFDPVTGDTLNPWYTTASTDSTFLVTADIPDFPNDPDDISRSYQTHTFLVRAIDEDGGVDPTPAYVSFNSTTILPTVKLTGPKSVTIQTEITNLPSTVAFLFEGEDSDFATGLPTSYRYLWKRALLPDGNYVRSRTTFNNNVDFLVPFADSLWTPWSAYDPNDETRRVTLPDQQELDAQNNKIAYVFAIQVRDTAGAVSIDRVYNKQIANIQITRSLAPTLRVLETFLGEIEGAGPNLTRALDVAAGQLLEFSWSATAADYAGIVQSYRYGWDVSDLSDPNDPNWSLPPGNTPQHRRAQPISFGSGSHTLTVEVRDNSNQLSRATVILNVVPVPDPTDQEPVLLVDDVFDRASNTWEGPPPVRAKLDRDAYRDDFWRSVIGGPGGVAGWDSLAHTIDSEERRLNYREAVGYRSLVWTGYRVSQGNSAVADLFRPAGGSVTSGDLDKYVWMTPYQQTVGNLLYVGSSAMLNYLADSSWELPIVFQSREGNAATGYERVRTYDVRRGFGYRELPDGTRVQVGLSRYPFSTMGVSVIDLMSPNSSLYEFGTGLRADTRRKRPCVGLKGLAIDPAFKSEYMPGGEVFADTIWTEPGIDWNDNAMPTVGDVLAYPYYWGNDEFYNADRIGRGTGWDLQQGEEWGCEGLCIEPMFRSIARFEWVKIKRQEVDPSDTWPEGYYGPPPLQSLNNLCGDKWRDPSFRSLTTDQTVAFISNKTAESKPSQVGDVVFGFDPYRFDNVQMRKVIRWVLGEHFGLSMTAEGK